MSNQGRGGFRTGSGRPKGSIGKKSEAIEQKLKSLDCDPIEALAMIAKDKNATPELRFQANKELAQYVAPKRKASESELSLDTGIHVNVLKYEEPKKIKTFKKELGEK